MQSNEHNSKESTELENSNYTSSHTSSLFKNTLGYINYIEIACNSVINKLEMLSKEQEEE